MRDNIISINKKMDLAFSLAVKTSALVTVLILFLLIGYIFFKGLPHIKPSLFALEYTTENVSMLPAIITTIIITFLSLVIATPIAVFTAIYLVEYAKAGNRFVGLIRLTTETLSGIPSIIYGLFGLLFFVGYLGWGFSIIAGILTLTIMILPIIIRSTEEAIKSVPINLREASLALGTSRLRTIFKIVLPSALSGIFAGIILAIGRIVGETAALIYTTGTVAQVPKNLFSSGRTLAIHMYTLSSEGFYIDQSYATAVILLIIVLLINIISSFLIKRIF